MNVIGHLHKLAEPASALSGRGISADEDVDEAVLAFVDGGNFYTYLAFLLEFALEDALPTAVRVNRGHIVTQLRRAASTPNHPAVAPFFNLMVLLYGIAA